MTGQVGRTRQLDDPLQGLFRGRHAFGIVVEPAPTRPPEVERREGVACGVRLHPAIAREVAGERLETQVAAALDRGQRRPLAGNPTDPVWPHRVAHDVHPQVVGAGERRDRIDSQGDFHHAGRRPVGSARAAAGHRDPREDASRMTEDRHADPVLHRLALEAEPPEPVDQSGSVGDHQVVDPRREPRPRLGRHPLGQLVRQGIPAEGRRDHRVDERFGLRPSPPVERGGRGHFRHEPHGDSPFLRLRTIRPACHWNLSGFHAETQSGPQRAQSRTINGPDFTQRRKVDRRERRVEQ
jgi:hypothetical protein